MTDDYPPWRCIYQRRPNLCLDGLRGVIFSHRPEMEAVSATPFRKSVEAEKLLADDMAALGFWHSVTNRRHPPLFKKGLNFEVDFFHPDFGVAVEIEKGEINNIWKNLCKFAESPAIRHGVLVVPVIRRGQQTSSEFYENTVKRLMHIENMFCLVDSVIIIGY
jgi:hypothetical protein